MKKSILFAGFLLLLFTNVVSAQCPTGSSSNRFTSLGQARTVTVAGVYYFNLSGTTFSTYVSENGYVQVAIDFGNGSGNLPQVTSLTTSSRGILTPTVLSRLTEANQVRISHSGGNMDVSTTNATILSRIRSNATIHRGVNDNGINNTWTGSPATAMTVDATCTTGSGNSLHQNVMHLCGPPSGFHWIPSTGLQRIRYSTGANSGEIPSNESLSLWVRANADTSCYTSVPDDAFEAYLEANGMGNGITNDNYVSTNNISSRTSISLVNQNGIADLTGIEDFTSLTSFVVSGGTNTFTSVDFSNSSNMTSIFIGTSSLSSINVNGLTNLTSLNLQNTSISSIDVSTNTSLQFLGLFGVQISSVDVSNHPDLRTLYLTGNNVITTLDLRNNPDLNSVYVNNSNSIETIDARNGNNSGIVGGVRTTNSPNLTCVAVDDVAYAVANWTNVDNSSVYKVDCVETYVPDDNFEAFLEANGMGNGVTNDNYVTTSNISSVTVLSLVNTVIADLTGIEDFAALQSIGMLFSNPITTADFSNNTNLTEIIVQTSTLTSINVSNLSNLTDLSLNNANISSIDLSDLTALRELNLTNTNVTSLDLSNNPALRELYMSNSSLSSLNVSANVELRQLDISNTNVSSIDISSNLELDRLDLNNLDNITTLDLRAFVNLNWLDISNMDNLQWVDLRNGNNNLLTSEFRATNLPNLTMISVDNRSYSVATWSNIDNAIVFQELNPTTYVPDGDFEAFLESNGMGNGTYNDDTVNTGNIFSVTSLDVSGQLIQDLTGIEGFLALESLTASSNSLSSIDVSNNTALTYLNVHSNASITAINVSALTSLESLVLYGTSITSIDVSNNTALKTLQLNNTNITSLDVSVNTALENLSIRNISGLTSVDLSANTALDFLDVQNASIPSLDLTNNVSLTQLYAKQGVFSFLDVQNGNNTNVTVFDITQNPSLSCVNVDNAAYSTTNWTSKDAGTSYGEHCYETYVPDNNFEAFLEANGMGNGVANDDYVTTANISAVTALDVDNENISDMTGIEGFTALTSLSANGNPFTGINLNSNTALTHLDLRNTSIATVNTNALTSLEGLYVSGTNSVISLYLANNTALKTLQVTSNQLASLDLSSNTALESLTVRFTSITSLDLSNNTALTYLDIQDMSLPSIDLSNNTALTSLYAKNGALTSLNVKNGNNTNMTTFSIHTNPGLQCVVVDDVGYATTNFTGIDAGLLFNTVSCEMTNVPDDNFENYLETHDANGNTVALGATNSMGNGVANDDQVFTHRISSVTALNVNYQSIADMTGLAGFAALDDLDAIGNSFSTIDVSANTALIHLELRQNGSLTGIDVSNLPLLQSLNINETNSITSVDVSNNPSLVTLQVTSGQVTSVDVSNNPALESLTVEKTSITSLDVSNNPVLHFLDARDLSVTTLDLSNNPALTHAFLQRGAWTSVNLKNGANTTLPNLAIHTSPNLYCIQVDDVAYANTNFTNKDAQAIFSETCGTTTIPDDNFENYLETHDASGNTVSIGAANSLGNGIANDNLVFTDKISSVTTLDISSQSITDITGIAGFTAMENLNVSTNNISTVDVSQLSALEELYVVNTAITTLDVSNNTALRHIEVSGTNLTALDLSNNPNMQTVYLVNMPQLLTVDLKNGNGTNITTFNRTQTASITCVNVDESALNYFNTTFVSPDMIPLANFNSHCFETYVPGDNFENYLETHNASGNVVPLGDPTSMGNGIANDDYVTTANIASVTTLNMQTQSIGSLTGIEGFAALTYFEVRGNNLFTSIDLSNNTSLEEAYIGSSPYNTINLSTLTSLRVLDIEDTQLTALDLSNNTALTTFKLRNSDITSLDFSSNTALTSLEISNSNLTTLNVKNGNNANVTLFDTSGSTNLTCILVDTETYSNTNWTSIESGSIFTDVSCGTTDIPNASFETFLETNGMGNGIANDNKVFTHNIASVTSLDVSGLLISDMTGIEDFVALEDLRARNNSFASIDLSTNTALTYLDLRDNIVLIGLDVSALSSLQTLRINNSTSISSIDISNNLALTTLDAISTGLSSLDVSANTALRSLAVRFTNITSLDLSTNVALESLDVQNMSMTTLDLSNNVALISLQAKGGAFTTINIKNGNNTNITTLSVHTNPSLKCMVVDDVAYATANFTGIDAGLIFNNVSCEMTSVPNDNFEAYLEANSLGNGVANDDLVFTHNIASVIGLDVDNQNISDLTGLEYFTALEALNARNNGLTSIDVSANTNLSHLFLDNNSLTTIDISGLTNLEEIGLTGNTGITSLNVSTFASLENVEIRNTGITSLDVTSNAQLISLDIRETGITTLDLSQNPNLTTFRANDSSLSSLDIRNGQNTNITTFDTTGVTNLTCVNVDDANYSTTNWTNIASGTRFAPDCSYIYMPDDNFEMYLETHNPSGGSVSLGDPNSMGNGVMDNYVVPARMELVSIGLDISGLNISDLTGIEGFKFVLNLDVSDNNITSLDLSGLNAVTLLQAYNNPITTMDISNSAGLLQRVEIYNTNLTLIDLTNQSALTTIQAGNVPLTSIDLSDVTALSSLDVSETNITSLDVSANTSLSFLDVSNTSITTLNVTGNLALNNFILSNSSISSLDLSSNTGLRAFTAQNSALTSLNIRNGSNTDIVSFDTTGSSSLTCIEVDNPVYSSTNWTNVDSGTSFSDVGCATTSIPDANFEAFLENNLLGNGVPNDNLVFTGNISVITSLDISNQNIANLTGIAAFTSLQTLNAENNNLSTVDLSSNTTLTNLNLAGNPSITSVNLGALTALQILNLSNTGISSVNVSSNSVLKTLNLEGNSSVSSVNVNSNTALEVLNLKNTSVSTVDISNNTALTTLDIEGTSITSVSLVPHTSLVSLNAKNAALTSLNIKNGNNSNVTTFDVTGNAGLSCITVDDAGYAVTNWTNIDTGVGFSLTTSCATTSVPDDNFEAFLEANGMGNGIANDNLVITANISEVNSLSISGKGISDLTGIEDFTALEVLLASNNSFSTANLTSNTSLITANLSLNASLTSVDVTGLSDLVTLRFFSTSVSAIDLSTNTALESVNFSNTNLTELDLSNNSSLRILQIFSNSLLQTVNIKNGNNTNITEFEAGSTSINCFNVDNVTYAVNNFHDISNSSVFSEYCFETYIPNNNFENYLETHDVNGNVVAVGDASSMGNGIANDNYVLKSRISGVTVLNMQNQSIADMTGIEDFTSLQELRLDGNTGLNAIDVSSNTNLTVLRLYQTNVSTLDVSALSNLGDLVIASTQITSIDVSNNTALFALDMRFTNIPTVDLSQNSSLTYLNALNASLTSLNVKNGNNTNVTTFELTGNSSLTCVIVDNPGYSYINWTDKEAGTSFTNTSDCTTTTSITDNNFEAYLEANNLGNGIANDDLVYTGNISGLTSLDISSQNITNLTGIEAFTSLTTLNISSNASIASVDVSALTALENLNISNTGITSLDLTSNTALTVFNGQNAALTSLNIKNGTNASITSFNTTGNSSLSCITVDDAGYSTTNWTNIDGTTAFSGLCGGTYVPDNNFETYLETHDDRGRSVPMGDAESLGNGVMDDYVLTSKIETLTSLFVSNQNISDLTGIEDFTTLRSLWVDENSLTSLDVSNNTNLDDLNCSSNSLTSIDVSDLTNLSSLDISNMSNITSIDLSNNTDLSSFTARNTGLTSLDLKAFTSLLSLDVSNAQLTSLDLRNGNNTNMTVRFDGNFDLTCVSVDDVDYANNNWDPFVGEFSLSCGETYVPDDAFEMYLETHDDRGFSVSMGSPSSLGNGSMDNFVTTSKLEFLFNLNLSGENVADLTGVKDFENLSNLDVSFTNITSLDLSGLQFITHLNLSNTSLTSLNVSSYNNLQVLDISDTSISSINLGSNGALQQINIGNTPMTSINLSSNTNLTSFEMSNGALTSLDLSSNTSLTDFSVNNTASLTTVDLRNGNNTNMVGFSSNSNTNLTCIQVDDADYSNTNWTSKDGHTSFGEDGCGVQLSIKVFLHGPYESSSGMMRASLGSTHLPTNTPHSDGATANSSVFDVTGNNAIVDWVWVELRDKNDITTVLHSASGLVQRDGDIVGVDGVSPIVIAASADEYYVSVDHRSHIPIASDATYSLSGTATTIDLTVSANVRGGSGFMHDLGNGKHATFGGDLNGDGQINTADLILGFASIGLPGYLVRDLDLNGQTQTSDMTNVLVKGLGKGKQF